MGCWIKVVRLFRANKTFFTVVITVAIITILHHEFDVLDNIRKHPRQQHIVHEYHHKHEVENRPNLALEAEGEYFKIDGKSFKIYSGEIHYFRIHPEYWEHRLGQLASSGLNTVSFYIPWNFHEMREGEFDFSESRDIRRFIKIAEKMHLHVMLRVGPYICAEWEWGGLPAWLLRHDNLKIRTNSGSFMDPAKKWLIRLVEEIKDLQHSVNGPIIAIQVENEYGVYEQDPTYLPTLRQILVEAGITEMLYTCDDKTGLQAGIPLEGTLRSINMQEDALGAISALRLHQPNRPVFISEYWTGWFDWWGDKHHEMGFPWKNTFSLDRFVGTTKEIIQADANFNLFMFHGGTNFGFWNGGIMQGSRGVFIPDTTSYDYDALVSEAGDLKPKFFRFQQIMKNINVKTSKPPKTPEKKGYGQLKIEECINLGQIMAAAGSAVTSIKPLNMEKFSDGYGYAVYETTIWGGGSQTLIFGRNIRDRAIIFVDAKYAGTIELPATEIKFNTPSSEKHTLSLLVENQGRVNWAASNDKGRLNSQRKGILGDVSLNGKILENWLMWPLSFNSSMINAMLSQKDWWGSDCQKPILPGLFKSSLTINEEPKDTFIKLPDWQKGVIFVNGFNIGRYMNMKPQSTFYIPAPLLKKGKNSILVFEERKIGGTLQSTDKHLLYSKK